MNGWVILNDVRIPAIDKRAYETGGDKPDIQKYNPFVKRGLMHWLEQLIISISHEERKRILRYILSKLSRDEKIAEMPIRSKNCNAGDLFFFIRDGEWEQLHVRLSHYLYDIPNVSWWDYIVTIVGILTKGGGFLLSLYRTEKERAF